MPHLEVSNVRAGQNIGVILTQLNASQLQLSNFVTGVQMLALYPGSPLL